MVDIGGVISSRSIFAQEKDGAEGRMMQVAKNKLLTGQGIAPGLAMGTAYIYEDILKQDQEYCGIEEHEVDGEYSRIQRAIESVLRDLAQSADRVGEKLDEEVAAIFHAQHAILDNSALSEELRKELGQELVNAGEVVKRVFPPLGTEAE